MSDTPTPDDWQACLRVLQAVSEDVSLASNDEQFKGLVAKINRQGRKLERLAIEDSRRTHDREMRRATGIVQTHIAQAQTVTYYPNNSLPDFTDPFEDSSTPLPVEYLNIFDALSPMTDEDEFTETLKRPVQCYICKEYYKSLHFYYHQLCPSCAKLNYRKRTQTANLRGRVALVTGGRVKIGYQTVLRLLRDGAQVVATTRFPRDAARRYAQETDFETWRDRLTLCALDLRRPRDVESFTDYLYDTLPHLDIVINNAAQTIKRPLAWYSALLKSERGSLAALPENTQALLSVVDVFQSSPLLESHPNYPTTPDMMELESYFPVNTFDGDGQAIDNRPQNSWTLKLPHVPSLELVEVLLVNSVAPFILNGRLKELLIRSPHNNQFIVNVSAMEGQFNRESKTADHPHTNMAKAALNMLTRTAAQDYATSRIFMNSVDTGWITDENPQPKRDHLRGERNFYPPLDVLDGVARVYDPIADYLVGGRPPFGKFFKDYKEHPW